MHLCFWSQFKESNQHLRLSQLPSREGLMSFCVGRGVGLGARLLPDPRYTLQCKMSTAYFCPTPPNAPEEVYCPIFSQKHIQEGPCSKSNLQFCRSFPRLLQSPLLPLPSLSLGPPSPSSVSQPSNASLGQPPALAPACRRSRASWRACLRVSALFRTLNRLRATSRSNSSGS